MKLRNLFVAAVAAVFALWSCEEEKPTLGITVEPDQVEIARLGGGCSIEIKTDQAWTITIPREADWLLVDPLSGTGSAMVNIYAEANNGKLRSASIIVKAGYDMVPVTVSQPGGIDSGDGLTMETAFSASEARIWVNNNLASGEVTSTKYYVKGIIHKVQTTFEGSGNFGNAVFFISDDGQASQEDFECYQVYYLGGRQWKSGDKEIAVGDDVIVYGPLTLYNTTPETAGKGAACLVKLNDEVVEPTEPENPTTVEQITCAEFIQKADQNTTYRLVGEVTSNVNTTYCSFDMNDGTATVVVWTVNNKDEWKDKVKKGGTVTVRGKYKPYTDNNGNTKHEMVDAYIEDFTDGGDTPPGPGGEDVDPAGNGTLESPYNVAAAVSAVANLTWTSNTDYQKVGPYYVRGKVSDITQNFDASGDYGNATFNLVDVDGGSNKLACYRILYFNGQKYVAGQTPLPAVGSEVIIYSELMNYRGNTPETVANAGSVYSIDGVTEAGGETPPEPPAPNNPVAVTIAEFNAAEESQTQPYILVGKRSNITSTVYGNFDLTDASGTVYVYGLTATNLGYGAQNDKSFANLGLAEGDEIKIIGYRGSFNNKIEVMYAYFVEKVGGGETPPVTEEALTVSEILALAKDKAFDSKPSLVVAITARGFVASDGSKNIYVYTQGTNFNGVANIGDMVKFSGKRDEYSGMPEVTPVTALEVVSSNNNVAYPEPKDVTASAESYSSTEAEYISITGTLGISTNASGTNTYYNLTLDNTTARQGSIVYPAEYLNAASYDGKKITITGYYNGLTSSKYINVITTKIEEAGGGQTGGDPVINNFQASFYQFGLSLSWDAVNGADYYEWELKNEAGARVALGVTDQTAVRSNVGTVNASAETNLGEAWYTESGSINGKYLKYGTYNVTLKAHVPGYTSDVTKNLTVENKAGVLNVTKLVGTDTGFEAEWSAYTGEDFYSYYWELHVLDASTGTTSRAITGTTTDPYVRNLPAQTTYVDDQHNTSWLVDGMVQGSKYYFVVVALAPKQNPNDTGNWLLAQSSGSHHFTFGASTDPVTISLDFKTIPSSDFPSGSGNAIKYGEYVLGGYKFVFNAQTGFYWNSQGYILIGKTGSFIALPAIEGLALKKVSFKTGSGASESVIVDIANSKGEFMNVNTSALKKGTEYTWSINGEAGAQYLLGIRNNYNAQFQNLTLYYE